MTETEIALNTIQTFLASPAGQLITGVAVDLFVAGTSRVLGKLGGKDTVALAIERTCASLDNPDGLDEALRKWAKNSRVKNAARGYRDANLGRVDLDALCDELLRTAGFEYGRHLSWPKADVVVRAFFVQLSWAAKDAPEWVVLFEERAEAREAKLLGHFQNGFSQLAAGQETIKAAITERNGQALPAVVPSSILQTKGSMSLGRLYSKAKRMQKRLQFKSAYHLFLAVADEGPAGTRTFAALKSAGQCAYRLGDKKTAAKHYARAARLRPGKDEGIACRVKALVWRGQYRAALRALAPLLRKMPHKGTYRALQAESLLELGNHAAAASVFLDDRAKLRVPSWRRSSTACYVLAYVLLRGGNAPDALAWARRALKLKPADIANQELFAAASVEVLMREQGPDWMRRQSSIRLAKRAESLLTKEIATLEGTDDSAMRVNAHVNRAATRLYLSAPDSATQDCEAAIAEDPDCGLAYAHLSRARILQRRAEDAVKAFESARSRGIDTPPLEGLAFGLLSLKSYDLAVNVTDRFGKLGEDGHPNLGDVLAAIESRVAAGQLERAELLLTRLLPKYEGHLAVSLVRAHLCEKRGDFGAAEAALCMAEGLATGVNERTLSNIESAGYFSRRGKWDEAIRHYETFVRPEVDNSLTKDYVRCLYHSADRTRNIPKCKAICRALRKRLGAIRPYTVLEGRIEENLGNVQAALSLYTELMQTLPGDSALSLRVAALQARMANPQAAAATVATVDPASVDNVEDLVMIAQILSSADKDVEALDVLYGAYRRFPAQRDIQLAYMWHIAARGQRLTAKLKHETIDGDSGVEILCDEEKRNYLLTTSSTPDPALNEVTSTSGLGATLLGHVEGDILQFHDGLTTCKVEVKAVFSKYVFVFRSIMESFHVKFPDFPGFHRIPVDMKSPDPLKNLLPIFTALKRQTDSALKLYQTLPLYIPTLSGLLGKDTIATCLMLMGDEGAFLHCSEGSRNEQVYEDAVVGNATGAVIDGTALVTMALLDKTLDIDPRLKRLCVPQSLYDATHVTCLRDHEVIENQLAAQGKSSPARTEVFSCRCFALLDKVERLGRDLPRIQQDPEEESSTLHVIEDSIDICTRLKLPLWSDDYRLRATLRQERGIPCFSTLAVLRSALAAQPLSPDDYEGALARLLLANYRLIPLTGRILYRVFEIALFTLSPAVERCLVTLESPRIMLPGLLGAVADTMSLLWKAKMNPMERTQLALRLRNVVAKRESPARNLQILMATTEDRLRLFPQAVDEIRELLKPGPGGIVLPG